MTHREKKLALIVGGGLAVLATWQVVKWTAIDPIQSMRVQLDAALERRVKLEGEAARIAMETRAWQDRTARTLHARPADARRIFRTEIDQLAQAHGLKDNLRVSDGMQQVDKAGFISLPVGVNCSGNANAVMNFLVDFYKLNYLTRITSVSLNAQLMSAPRGDRNAPPPEPKLAVTINAAALVLPSLKDVKVERHGDYVNVDPINRLAREASEYTKLTERNIFAKWVPKRPPPPPIPTTRKIDIVHPGLIDTPPGPPPVDKRSDADQYKIVMSEALHNVAYVAVQYQRKLEDPPTEYRVDAEVDGGTVVLIQPSGMVVRVQEDQNGSSQTMYYFYELGKTFKDRTPITPESHPDLAATLNLASAS